MKFKKYLFIIATLMSISCTDWLNVKPSETVSEDKLFEVSAGYRVALNGVYKLASSPSLYGKEMTWGLMSAFSRDYQFGYGYISSSHQYAYAANQYNYSDYSSIEIMDPIWKTAYKCIVNCNNLIGKVKKEDSKIFIMGDLEQNLIMGEAFAMRGMLHFDILRLYAPAPIKDDGKPYIPYYDQDGLSTGQTRLNVKQTLAKIVKDLNVARDLVAPFDTLDDNRKYMLTDEYRFATKQSPNLDIKDLFFAARGYRMNYTAITAMLARVYNYMGEHTLAYDEASKIINMVVRYNNNNYYPFTFTNLIKVDENRMTSNDLIFTLQDVRMYDNYLPYSQGTSSGDICYFVLDSDLESLFTDPADYRFTKLTKPDEENKKIPLKHVKLDGSYNKVIEDMLPMIRLSEMYYIQAEYFASIGKFKEAADAIDMVRIGRNCSSQALSINDKTSFDKELLNESKREFIGEGQTYYFYKKLGVKLKSSMKDEHFIFPRPIDEDVQN